jgi:hypothetical protein
MFVEIRSDLIESQVVRTFQEFLAIAAAQRSLLQRTPADWAHLQAESLTNKRTLDTAHWIKSVCDNRPDAGLNLDEDVLWQQWRAPAFLMMKPSGYEPYDSKRVWERQDQATSVQCLERFASDLEFRLWARLRDAAGEARLAEAKNFRPLRSEPKNVHRLGNQIVPSAKATAPEGDSRFTHSDDYRSIRFRGENHSLSHHQAIIVATLHKAHLAGLPDVAKAKLLAAIQAETSEVRDSFRKSALWKTLVCRGSRRGSYRINLGFEPEE